MSLTSYRAAPPRAKNTKAAARQAGSGFWNNVNGFLERYAGCKAWRRPTLPQLKLKYHWRCPVSRPSSGWDRVGHGRYGHQAMVTAYRSSRNRAFIQLLFQPTFAGLSMMVWIHQARIGQLGPVSSMRYRTSTPGLSRSWSSTVLRYLILREASRLDAFSGYPVHA